jgi:hypothetical protein
LPLIWPAKITFAIREVAGSLKWTRTPAADAMSNPYAVPATLAHDRGVYADHARLVRGGFLYRVIELEAPFVGTLVYDGWWFRQRITINGIRAWFRISWLTIFRNAEFQVPAVVDGTEPTAHVEIMFTRGLSIRRFRIWVADELVYDEIN